MLFPLRDLLRREFRQILIAGLAVLAILGFLAIGELVEHGAIERFDDSILLALRNPAELTLPRGPAWLPEAMRDITSLGGVTIIVLVTLIVTGVLIMRHERALLGLVLTIVLGGALLEKFLKGTYGRSRPSIIPHLVEAHAGSFPSGHSMMSAVVYLSLAALLARAEPSFRVRGYILSVALMLTLLIGFSRVYLGVHYPSDVLAGWLLGMGWSAFCWVAGRSLHRRSSDSS